MLSIVICSRNKELADAVSQNISLTIGIDFELIILDNSVDVKSINLRYNEGAEKAKYEYLLFVHEDVAFLKPGWGTILTGILNDERIGIVGLAGSKYCPQVPGTWPNQRYLTRENVFYKEQHLLQNPDKETLAEVVTLDGVFLACRKEVWIANRFDDKLTGFHYYDMDYCFRVITFSTLKLVVTYDIFMSHFSYGSLNKDWIDQSIFFYKKWSYKLPLTTKVLTKQEEQLVEKEKLKQFVQLFYFKYDGSKKMWLVMFYLKHFLQLGLSQSLIYVIRYIMFGSAESRFNVKLASMLSNKGNNV